MTYTDDEAPVLTCPAKQAVNTEPSRSYAKVVWTDPQAIDNSRDLTTITCDFESGSYFEIGETQVTCQAVDPTGNWATCTFDVQTKGDETFF